MGWWSEWANPVWTGLEVAFTPTELNVGEDQWLAGYDAGGGGHHDHHFGVSHFGNDFGHDHGGVGSSTDLG